MKSYPSLSILVLLALAACSPAYTYVPVTTSSAEVSGAVAADYPLPKGAGDVKLLSLGVVDAHPQGAPQTKARALHVRLLVDNKGSGPWTIETGEQRLAIPGIPEIHAGRSTMKDNDEPSHVEVISGSKGEVDLYFLLPPEALIGKSRPEIAVRWTVHTPSGILEQRTTFDRVVGTLPAGDEDVDDVTGRGGGSSSPAH